MTRKTDAPEPIILIECVCPSCKADVGAPLSRIHKLGWKDIRLSNRPVLSTGSPRSHIGFCPECAEKYGVEK